jgi:hypothetical protein
MCRPAIFYCLFSLFAVSSAQANTVTANSCNASDVQTAFNSITSATTIVNIPAGAAGTCNWTTQVTLTIPSGSTSLSILGAGSLTTTGGGDVTVITDGYASSNTPLVINTGASSSLFRLAGITFEGGDDGGAGNTKWNGMVAIGGTSQNVRVDHTHFNTTTYSVSQNGTGIVFDGAVLGVTDHNIFDGDVGGVNNMVRAYQGNLYGDSAGYGDGSWANNTSLGSSGFMFFEDNTFNNGIADDCTYGGRFVMRYNTFNASSLQTHPTGGAGADARGCRAWEIYNNTFTASNTSPVFDVYFLSAGTGVIWGNSAPTGYENFISIHSMRRDDSTYAETPPPNGWGYCGTSFDGTGSAWDQNTNTTTGYACIDQPGRGKGDLITGTMPNAIDSATGSISWVNEALEPVYEWLDTYTGAPGYPDLLVNNYEPDVLVQNQDFYLYTASFNGTSGVGSGLSTSLPSTCTPMVAYWANDTNTLYQCASTNHWTPYYTPYTYPHPLTQGSGGTTTTTSTTTTQPGGTTTTTTTTLPESLPVPDLSALNGKTFALTDEISFSYPVSGVTFQWVFATATNNEQRATSGQIDSSLIAQNSWLSGAPTATTSVPSLTPASAGLTPGVYALTITVTQGSQAASGSATITLVASDFSAVQVYPNPWRSDKHAGKSVTFANLPMNASVKIFTTSGHLARDLGTVNGSVTWDLKNDSGDKVASGIYLYIITDGQGDKVRGEVAVIK